VCGGGGLSFVLIPPGPISIWILNTCAFLDIDTWYVDLGHTNSHKKSLVIFQEITAT
jgi:hypothetical protein